MNGDDLVTAVTVAASDADALAIALAASVQARYSAADLLYVPDIEAHGKLWVCRQIVKLARA